MKKTPAMLAVLAFAACSQQPGTAGAPVPKGSASTSGALTAAAGEPAGKEEEEDWAAAASKAKFTDGRRAFETVRDTLLKSYYADGVGEDEVYRAATQGMLEHLEPKLHKWNKLLGPEEVAELHTSLKGEIVGIGVQIKFDKESGFSDVLGALPGSPAEKVGLVAGDKIVSVDGKLYKGLSVADIVGDIRGKVGETVTLSVLRDGKLLSVPVTRAVVSLDEVSELLLPGGVGYLRISSFNAKTTPLLKTELDDLSHKGTTGLVLDLRGNQGGGFENAVASAEQFLPAGVPIVSVGKRDHKDDAYVSKNAAPVLATVPMVVLVDHATSSGAELTTAALQEGRHAQVVGQRTFGKWTVQTIDDLSNGFAFKYTVGLFRSPSGRSFEGVGLVPDVEVDMDSKELDKLLSLKDVDKRLTADAQLRTAASLLRAKP